jgi:hypothetical protein
MDVRLVHDSRFLHLGQRWLIASFGIALGLLAACAPPTDAAGGQAPAGPGRPAATVSRRGAQS